MDPFGNIGNKYELGEKKWIEVLSDLESLDSTKKKLKIELMEDGLPRAVAFFDIDGTLAHLSDIHGKAISKLFPEANQTELEETYYRGFKLGNSFREFDRMKGIYIDGHTEWKDPEIYYQQRFLPNKKEIDEPDHLDHNIAARILTAYGEIAAQITEELYKQDPAKFEKSNIVPMFKLARMYARLGIPMVGFTANAKIFVEKLAKYLKLSDLFIDIATDEDMSGGGKEIAIEHLIKRLEEKGIPIPEGRMIFVGDSLRGDIGVSLKGGKVSGQGILVLKDQKELAEIQNQINQDPELRILVDSIQTNALVLEDVPVDEKGDPMLLSRFRDQFLKKL